MELLGDGNYVFVDIYGGGKPVGIHMDCETAGRDALRRELSAFRRCNLYEHGFVDHAHSIDHERWVSDPGKRALDGETVTDWGWEDAARIGAILGRDFAFIRGDEGILPPDVTDQQIQEIMGLTALRFYTVAEAVFAG